eukprot:TRINITY_DN3398_c0_g1_i1.p2 TRINITY_DN3398_c0_g1~~TRINITY_DN3398_c0_g1_i1.p2  ORF type:complete len:120 (-),score=9.01 TRINITY_DN3398_c0_g1_i1:590-949(-)
MEKCVFQIMTTPLVARRMKFLQIVFPVELGLNIELLSHSGVVKSAIFLEKADFRCFLKLVCSELWIVSGSGESKTTRCTAASRDIFSPPSALRGSDFPISNCILDKSIFKRREKSSRRD